VPVGVAREGRVMKIRPASNSRRLYRRSRELADVILTVLAAYPDMSMSTRQIYYQCVSRGVIQNGEKEYDRVQQLVLKLRRSGDIDYDRIVDRRRAKHHRGGWQGAESMLHTFGEYFRRDIWASQNTIVMIGLEKEALEGVFAETVDEYGASLWPFAGYISESFAYEWATEINEYVDDGKHVTIYYFGDHDPTGLDIERDAIEKLRRFDAKFAWGRKGLLWNDFNDFDLINIPVKITDTRSRSYLERYGNRAAELDALPPDELQRRIRQCFDNAIDHEALERVRREEEIQRESIRLVADNWKIAVAAAGGA
jgi:hypothetical protein